MQLQVAEMMKPIQGYVLLNSTDEEIVMEHAGAVIRIPPRNLILRRHPKYDDVPHSLILGDKYVPGTVVLRDVIVVDEFGGHMAAWSAAEAIRSRLGIDTRTGTCSSEYAQKGVSVLPEDCTEKQIAAADKDGVKRYMKWRQRDAARIIHEHDSRNQRRKAANMEPFPPDEEYLKAEAALSMLQASEQARLREEFSKMWVPVDEGMVDTGLYETPDGEPAETQFKEIVPEVEQGLVEAPEPEELTPEQLAELVKGNKKALAILKKDYNIRKRGSGRKPKPKTRPDEVRV